MSTERKVEDVDAGVLAHMEALFPSGSEHDREQVARWICDLERQRDEAADALTAERQRADEAEKIAEATAESAEAWLHKYRDLEPTVVRAVGEAGRKQGEAEARADAAERSLSEAREALAAIRDSGEYTSGDGHARCKEIAARALASGTQEGEVGDGE